MRNKSKSSLGRTPAIDRTKDDEPSTSAELISLTDTASFAEGAPTMASLPATSSSNGTCCEKTHSEQVELETFLQQPPIVMNEDVWHPKLKDLPFGPELLNFRNLLRSPSSTLFQDFSHFFKELKKEDLSRWRFHSFERHKIPDPAKRPPFVEERINVYVRGNHNLPASNCFESCMVEDEDFFVGESRLLQYCALRCLRLGDVALCKAIAKVRKDEFYPDYASSIDWDTCSADRQRSTPASAVSTSSRSSSSAAVSCPPLSTARGGNTSPETRERPHSEQVELETFLQQPPIVMNEDVWHPNSTVWKGFPFVREFEKFRNLLRSPSSTLFQDFSHFFKELKKEDLSRWRFHSFERHKIPDPAKRPPFVEERIKVYVRGNHNLPASNCFNVGMVEDEDFFVGESRLLQYCALRCLRLGDVALCKAIAKVRKDEFYPDYASNIDWDTWRSTPASAVSMSSSSSSSAAAASTANVSSCTQLSTFSSSSSSSSSSSLSNKVNGAQSSASNDTEERNLIEVFSRPTPLPHPSNTKDVWFREEFSLLHKNFKKGALNVASFKELYSMLRKANDRWRFVTEWNQDANGQRASRKKGYVIEDFDATGVRVYFGLSGAPASEYAKQQKDVDYFVGDDRLLQYVGMQTLRYGSLALASEIADIRERFGSGSFPLVSNNDAPVRTTEDSNTPPSSRHREEEEETLVNNDTMAQQQDATVLSKSRPLSPTSSERSRKRRRQSSPSQDAVTNAHHTERTQNGHGDHRASTTLPPLQPPPLAPAKSATINATRTSLLQHVVMSDEDSDEIATHGTNPGRSRREPHVTADSKPEPTRQQLMCSKLRGNSHLTFYDTKKG